MCNPLKILIVDDHSMIRKGMRLTLETSFGIKTIEEAASCSKMLSSLRDNLATHLILDLLIDDGNSLEIVPSLRSLYPELRILIFSMQPSEVYASILKQYGVFDYLHKEAEEDLIIATLKKFLFEEPVELQNVDVGQQLENSNPFSKLSARELEVLHYLLKGTGTKKMSEMLNLQMSTISTIKYRIFEKMGTENIKELIDLAIAHNINS